MGEIVSTLAGIGATVAFAIGGPIGIGVGIGLLALSVVTAPKPKKPDTSALNQQRDLSITIRSSTEPHKIVYGEAKVSGALLFSNAPEGAAGSLWLVVELAAHKCDALGELYLNDSIAHARVSDGQSYYRQNIRSSAALNLYSWWFEDGDDDQAAQPDLITFNPGTWTANHRLRGIAYVVVRLSSDPTVWTTGVPNISVVTKGRQVYDPRITPVDILTSSLGAPGIFETDGVHGLVAEDRVFIVDHASALPAIAKEFQIATVPTTSTFTVLGNDATGSIGESLEITQAGSGGTVSKMLWTDNAALCILDHLLSRFGFNCDLDEIDVASFIAGANISDEMVPVTEVSDAFTAVASTDLCTRTDLAITIGNGDGVELTTTNTLPAGLSTSTTYYYIRQHPSVSIVAPDAGQPSAFNFKLATSLANARAGVAINITDAGTGTHTIVRKSQPRYTCDGAHQLDLTPLEVLRNMLSSCAGMLVPVQGKFRLLVGAYASPEVTLTEDDLRGELTMRSRTERKDLFNTLRGTFVDADNAYQATDFPQITSATLKEQDGGEEIVRDIELPYTRDATRCQRLAKIALLRARTGGRVITFPAKLTALRIAAGDTVAVSIADLGLVEAPFLVTDWRLSSEGGLGVDLTLSAIAEADFAWSAEEAATADRPPQIQLLDASFVPPPGLTLDQDTVPTNAGDAVPRMLVTITPPTDAAISGYEVEYRLASESTYIQLSVGALLTHQVVGVTAGETYDVRARSVSGTGAKSEYVSGSIDIDTAIIGSTLWDSVPGNMDTWGLVDGL